MSIEERHHLFAATSGAIPYDAPEAARSGWHVSSVQSPRPWTLDEFFAWQERQSERYELVDGFPRRHRMMAGAGNRHDDIVVNIIGDLKAKLRGTPCRPFTADGSVKTGSDRIRRPDVGVDCGKREPRGHHAAIPVVVFEVLSPSTRSSDLLVKDAEYRKLPSLRHIVYVEQDVAEALHWWRRTGDEEWELTALAGLEAVVDLAAIEAALTLRDVYDGLDIAEPSSKLPPPGPR